MKYSGKKYLLIAGGGTLGTYVSNELLRLGGAVDVICPEEKLAVHPSNPSVSRLFKDLVKEQSLPTIVPADLTYKRYPLCTVLFGY